MLRASLPNVRNEMGKKVTKVLNPPPELNEAIPDEDQSEEYYSSEDAKEQRAHTKSGAKKRSRSSQGRPKSSKSKSKKQKKQRRDRSPTDSSDFATESQHSSSNYEDEYDDITL